jgi:hypothetical protein
MQRVLDALAAPAWIRNGRADVVAAARRALHARFDDPVRPANTARFTFLRPAGLGTYRTGTDRL